MADEKHSSPKEKALGELLLDDAPEKVKGPELGNSGPALRGLAAGGDSLPGMLSVLNSI
jgi:hypothetical protein